MYQHKDFLITIKLYTVTFTFWQQTFVSQTDKGQCIKGHTFGIEGDFSLLWCTALVIFAVANELLIEGAVITCTGIAVFVFYCLFYCWSFVTEQSSCVIMVTL